MAWLRRILSAPLILLAFVCAVGAVRIFTGNLPASSVGEGVMAAIFAAAAGAGAYFLLRPEIRRLREMSIAQMRAWIFANPLGQAALLWLAAAPIMAAAPKAALLPGFVAQCVYTVLSTRAAGIARRFWPTAILALLGFILLMGALAGMAEAITPRGFGEGGMVFLLPMYGFLILLPAFGIVRWLRKSKAAGEERPRDSTLEALTPPPGPTLPAPPSSQRNHD
jgi:hypothetical protein